MFGTRIPLPWTASGRLLVAQLTDDEIRELVMAEDLAIPNGQRISLDGLIGEVRQAQASGYCMTSGLVDAFTHCVAAPIFGPKGQVVATLCLVLPVDTTTERCEALRDLLMARGLALSTLPREGGSVGARASGLIASS